MTALFILAAVVNDESLGAERAKRAFIATCAPNILPFPPNPAPLNNGSVWGTSRFA